MSRHYHFPYFLRSSLLSFAKNDLAHFHKNYKDSSSIFSLMTNSDSQAEMYNRDIEKFEAGNMENVSELTLSDLKKRMAKLENQDSESKP